MQHALEESVVNTIVGFRKVDSNKVPTGLGCGEERLRNRDWLIDEATWNESCLVAVDKAGQHLNEAREIILASALSKASLLSSSARSLHL
jgi:hypothetical protein